MPNVGSAAGPRVEIAEVGVTVHGFEDVGGVLGLGYIARFFQDGRLVELSSNAGFEATAQDIRSQVRQAVRDAGYGEVAANARIRVAGE